MNTMKLLFNMDFIFLFFFLSLVKIPFHRDGKNKKAQNLSNLQSENM